MKPIRLFIAGDSTAATYPQERSPMAGWGQMIGRYFNDSVVVVNEARNGRSSKSFIDEGHLNAGHGCDAGRGLPADPVRA